MTYLRCPFCEATLTASPEPSAVHCPWCDREFAPGTEPSRQVHYEAPLSGEWKATLAMAMVAGAVIAFVAQFVMIVFRMKLLAEWEDAHNGGAPIAFNRAMELEAQLEDWEHAAENLGLVLALTCFATGVAFLIWLYHASDNLRFLEVEGLTHTPAGAVGSFFMPIANLFVPHVILQEIFQASDPRAIRTRTAWRGAATMRSVTVWWLGYLAASICSVLAGLASTAANDFETQYGILILWAGAHLAMVISLAALLYVIYTVEHHQQERHEAVLNVADD